MKLVQKKIWIQRNFELTDYGVKMCYKSPTKTNEVEVSYKSIKGDQERMLEGYLTFYIIFRICTIGWIVSYFASLAVDWVTEKDTLVIILLGFTSLIIYYFTRQDLIKVSLDNDTKLYFFKNRPTENEVNNFIDAMIERRDELMRSMYLDFDEFDSYENQKHNLNILFNYKVIDQEEFQNEKKRLKEMFNIEEAQQKEIGFN